MVPTVDGGHEKKPTGPPHLIDDLQSIEWKKRTVYICFDSDVVSKKHASTFKQSKYAGAWGAEFVLAELLRAQGAGPVFSTATFIGYILAGGKGALLATMAIFLPAFVLDAFTGPLVPRLRKSTAVMDPLGTKCAGHFMA